MDKMRCRFLLFFKRAIELCYYLLACYGLILLVFWFFDNEPPIKIILSKVDRSVVRPGGVIVFEQHIQKFRQCPGKVSRFIRGDCGFLDLPTISTALRDGNHVVRIPVDIPSNFQSGSCYMFSIHTFRCNILDSILNRRNIISDPIPFYVEGYR